MKKQKRKKQNQTCGAPWLIVCFSRPFVNSRKRCCCCWTSTSSFCRKNWKTVSMSAVINRQVKRECKKTMIWKRFNTEPILLLNHMNCWRKINPSQFNCHLGITCYYLNGTFVIRKQLLSLKFLCSTKGPLRDEKRKKTKSINFTH